MKRTGSAGAGVSDRPPPVPDYSMRHMAHGTAARRTSFDRSTPSLPHPSTSTQYATRSLPGTELPHRLHFPLRRTPARSAHACGPADPAERPGHGTHGIGRRQDGQAAGIELGAPAAHRHAARGRAPERDAGTYMASLQLAGLRRASVGADATRLAACGSRRVGDPAMSGAARRSGSGSVSEMLKCNQRATWPNGHCAFEARAACSASSERFDARKRNCANRVAATRCRLAHAANFDSLHGARTAHSAHSQWCSMAAQAWRHGGPDAVAWTLICFATRASRRSGAQARRLPIPKFLHSVKRRSLCRRARTTNDCALVLAAPSLALLVAQATSQASDIPLSLSSSLISDSDL